MDESGFFAAKLSEAGIDVDGLVINRCQPRFTDRDLAALDATRRCRREPPHSSRACGSSTDLADREDEQSRVLVEHAWRVVARVEELDHDVHDLAGIAEVAARLRE